MQRAVNFTSFGDDTSVAVRNIKGYKKGNKQKQIRTIKGCRHGYRVVITGQGQKTVSSRVQRSYSQSYSNPLFFREHARKAIKSKSRQTEASGVSSGKPTVVHKGSDLLNSYVHITGLSDFAFRLVTVYGSSGNHRCIATK